MALIEVAGAKLGITEYEVLDDAEKVQDLWTDKFGLNICAVVIALPFPYYWPYSPAARALRRGAQMPSDW